MENSNVAPVKQALKISKKSNSQIKIYPWRGAIEKKNIENKSSLKIERNNEVSVTSLKQRQTKGMPKIVNKDMKISIISENPQPLKICKKRDSKVRINPWSGYTHKTCQHDSRIKVDSFAVSSDCVVHQHNFTSSAHQNCSKSESLISTPEVEFVETKKKTSTTDEDNAMTCIIHAGTLANTREGPQTFDLVSDDNDNYHQPEAIHNASDLSPPLVTYSILSYSPSTRDTKENTAALSPINTNEYSESRDSCSSQLWTSGPELENVVSDTSDSSLMLDPLDFTTKMTNEKYITSTDRSLNEILIHNNPVTSNLGNQESCEKFKNSEMKELPSLVSKDFLICLSAKKRRSPTLTTSLSNSQEIGLHISETNEGNENINLLPELSKQSSKRSSHIRILEQIVIKRPKSDPSNEDNRMNDSDVPSYSMTPNTLQTIPGNTPTELIRETVIKSTFNRSEEDATAATNEQGESCVQNTNVCDAVSLV